MTVEKFRYTVAHEYQYAMLSEGLVPRRWYHVCIIQDNAHVTVLLQGNEIHRSVLQSDSRPSGDVITLGYIKPITGVNYVGNVSQFNIWQRVLLQTEINDIVYCRRNIEGDVISWSGKWIYRESNHFLISMAEFCAEFFSYSFLVLNPMTFYESAFLCEGIGGYLANPTNITEIRSLYNIGKLQRPRCHLYWGGVWDEEAEGVWVSRNLDIRNTIIPWTNNEPDGLHFENCGGIDPEGIIDDACTSERYGSSDILLQYCGITCLYILLRTNYISICVYTYLLSNILLVLG